MGLRFRLPSCCLGSGCNPPRGSTAAAFVARAGAFETPRGGSCGSARLCHFLSRELTCSLLSGCEGWVQNQMGGWTGAFVASLTTHRQIREVAVLEKQRASKLPP